MSALLQADVACYDGRLGTGVVSKGLLHCTCMIGPHRWTIEEDRAFQADSKVKMGRERALLMCMYHHIRTSRRRK